MGGIEIHELIVLVPPFVSVAEVDVLDVEVPEPVLLYVVLFL